MNPKKSNSKYNIDNSFDIIEKYVERQIYSDIYERKNINEAEMRDRLKENLFKNMNNNKENNNALNFDLIKLNEKNKGENNLKAQGDSQGPSIAEEKSIKILNFSQKKKSKNENDLKDYKLCNDKSVSIMDVNLLNNNNTNLNNLSKNDSVDLMKIENEEMELKKKG